MFWTYNSSSSGQIDDLLKKEDVTLNELLEEDQVLQECKVKNKALIDYLTRPDILKELVMLVVTEPPQEQEVNVQFKLANIAAELLTCEVPPIIDQLGSSPNLLLILYKFLQTDEPLNPLLASFVSRIFGMLVQRRSDQNWYAYQIICFQVLNFLKNSSDFVPLAVRHIGTSAIMDLLEKLICGVNAEEQDIKDGIHEWLNDNQLIEKLVGKLQSNCTSDEHASVDQLICAIVEPQNRTGSNSEISIKKTKLAQIVESEEIVNQLLDMLFLPQCSESTSAHVVNILMAMLAASGGERAHSACSNSESSQNGSSVLSTINSRLSDLQEILTVSPKDLVLTSFNTQTERLGTARLRIVTLFTALILTKDKDIHARMVELGTMKILFDLFYKFTLHNFLHTEVTKCVLCIVTESLTSDNCFNLPLPCSMEIGDRVPDDGLNNNPNWLGYDEEVKNNREKARANALHNTNGGGNNSHQNADNGGETKETKMEVEKNVCDGENVDGGGGEERMDDEKESQEKPSKMDTVSEAPQMEEDGDGGWDDGEKHPLLCSLFTECLFIQRLLEAYSKEPEADPSGIHNLQGYMGHLREIANGILQASMGGPNSHIVHRLFKALPDTLVCEWEDFSTVTLAELNLKNKIIHSSGFCTDMNPVGEDEEEFRKLTDVFPSLSNSEAVFVAFDALEDDENADDVQSQRMSYFDQIWTGKEREIPFQQQDIASFEAIADRVERTHPPDPIIQGDPYIIPARRTAREQRQPDRESETMATDETLSTPEKKNEVVAEEVGVECVKSGGESSSEDEIEHHLDDEFDTLRSDSSKDDSKIDTEDLLDEWGEVFDRRSSLVVTPPALDGNCGGTDSEDNPWENSPAFDPRSNTWADFELSPFKKESNKESGSSFGAFTGFDSSPPLSQPDFFQATFSDVIFTNSGCKDEWPTNATDFFNTSQEQPQDANEQFLSEESLAQKASDISAHDDDGDCVVQNDSHDTEIRDLSEQLECTLSTTAPAHHQPFKDPSDLQDNFLFLSTSGMLTESDAIPEKDVGPLCENEEPPFDFYSTLTPESDLNDLNDSQSPERSVPMLSDTLSPFYLSGSDSTPIKDDFFFSGKKSPECSRLMLDEALMSSAAMSPESDKLFPEHHVSSSSDDDVTFSDIPKSNVEVANIKKSILGYKESSPEMNVINTFNSTTDSPDSTTDLSEPVNELLNSTSEIIESLNTHIKCLFQDVQSTTIKSSTDNVTKSDSQSKSEGDRTNVIESVEKILAAYFE